MNRKLNFFIILITFYFSNYAQNAASVNWSLKTTISPIVAGAVTAADEVTNNVSVAYDGAVVFNAETITELQKLKPSDTDGSWPVESSLNADRYIQFQVTAKTGIALTIDSVKCLVGAKGSNSIYASFVYSTDIDFSNSTIIEENVLLPQGGKGLDILRKEFSVNSLVNETESFYLRVYPFNTTGDNASTSKYIYIQDVRIIGTTTGEVPVELPSIETEDVTYISVASAISGGTITSDGGAAVTARGVCWNTTGSPTIEDSKTENGTGSGAFESNIENLSAGLTYFVRAYATNEGGTAYGEEKSFTTLSALESPTVTTSSVRNILVTSAECGGNVVSWGGADITGKGVCWNTTGNPTIADNKTDDGEGIGSFNSFISNLVENTIYYIRAYATNSIGTGYGSEVSFTTQSPDPDVVKIVAKDGSGDYTNVQAAFDDVPDFYTGKYTIYVKRGIYYEKLLLEENKINVVLVGEDRDSTVLTYDDYAGKAGGTSKSYSTAIDAPDFTAIDITFQNSVKNDGSFADQQGVALRVDGDRQSYYNCKLLGYQDTYYTWGGSGTGRIYMKNCYIEGSVDFIFGHDIVVFDSCEIHINRNGGTLTAASTEPDSKFGYVFLDCLITAEEVGFDGAPITSFVLGRPWQQSPRTVFLRCEEPATLSAQGWLNWNVSPGLYAEYMCTGPGADFSTRNSISRQLTSEEAATYTIENIFAKDSNPLYAFDWMPLRPVVTSISENFNGESIPADYALTQNYPNPFNPTTRLRYNLPETSRVNLVVYDVLGEEVRTLVNQIQQSGEHEINFDASDLTSGVYFCRLSAKDYFQIIKMVLLK